MNQPSLSIVIPTFKRGSILRECLTRIGRQTAKDAIEVIVVSDGEMDKETALLAKGSFQFPTAFFSIPKSQQGTARNFGVARAKGEVTLFLGDDMFLEPDACEVHLRRLAAPTPSPSPLRGEGSTPLSPGTGERGWGDRGLIAVLGHITWDPTVGITPTMRWLEESGWQFGYPLIEKYAHGFVPTNIQHRFTYTGNISVPTAIARKFPFKEEISLYGWEDVEWGMRLKEAGVPLFYEPDAKALHHHTMTLEKSLRRMETLGKSAVIFEKMKPELNIVPKGWKRLAYQIAALFPNMSGMHRKAFLDGISSTC